MSRGERGLPHDWHLEQALLGSLLLNPEMLEEVRTILRARDFHRPSHVRLFGLLCEMAEQGASIDPVSVGHRVMAMDRAEEFGGFAYVSGLPNFASFADLAPAHARDIAHDAERRTALLKIRELEERLLADPAIRPAAALADLLDKLDGQARTTTEDEWVSLGEATATAVDEIRRRTEDPDGLPGLPTGWVDLDRILAGWRPGRLYVIGARPKAGKSAFVEQTAIHAARRGHGVGFISLEMDRLELAERALVQTSRLDASKVVRGELDEEATRRLLDADEQLSRLPLFVSDRPAQSLGQVRASAKRLRARCAAARAPLAMLVIDYLQLMGGDGDRGANREQVIAGLSRGLKLLAKELAIPILLLSQLSRKLEERGDKRPVPSDLRESGAIEQDADGILMLYRDEVYNPNGPKRGVCEVLVRALRGGKPGSVELAFIGAEYRFGDLERRLDEPMQAPAHPPTRRKRKGGGRPPEADPTDDDGSP